MYISTSPLNKAIYFRPLRFRDKLKLLNILYLRQQQRKTLGRLSDHMLNDLGITRDQAINESQRWFWQ